MLSVHPDDPSYRAAARAEADFWARYWLSFDAVADTAPQWMREADNRALTGNPGTHWLDDLIARGPFERAAMLGCNEAVHEATWITRRASRTLDVYELSPAVIERVRGQAPGARFIRADLNFVELPAATYDIIWSSGCIHHVTNLEYLFAQVARALRPGGIFAVHDYVGECRLQYRPDRLAFVNSVFRRVPSQLWVDWIDQVRAADPNELSPFCAVRSEAILPLLQARFAIHHRGQAGALFPLGFLLRLDAIASEAPEVVPMLLDAEAEAARRWPPCAAYVVATPHGE